MPEIQVQARPSRERPVCVSCRGELGSTDAALACTECAVPLHWECWRGLKRCPTAGCAGKAKHSDRLTAQLAEWGPAAPVVRAVDEPPEDERRTAPPRPGSERTSPHPAKGGGPPPAEAEATPSPARPAQVSPARTEQRSVFEQAGVGVTHDADYLKKQGTLWGMLAGSMLGMILAMVYPQHPTLGQGLVGLFGGLVCGAPLGAGLGHLQSIVGLRDPQPEGLGLISFAFTGAAVLAGHFAGSWLLSVLFALPVWLLCGRLFGFDPGKTPNR